MRTPISLVAAALLAAAGQAGAFDLTVEVNGNPQARLMAAVYGSADGWLKDGQAVQLQAGAPGAVRLVFNGLPAGRYAVTLFEDANGNGALDRNLLGIPTERYGFSRDARGRMGPPGFDDAAIELRADTTVTVTLP